MPPSFTPSHAWVCPGWEWSWLSQYRPHATELHSSLFLSSSSTTLQVANDTASAVNTHVDVYTDDGDLVTGVDFRGNIDALCRREGVLADRSVVIPTSGDASLGGAGWFKLWATGPVTAGVRVNRFALGGTTLSYPVPIRPVEVTVDLAPPPPFVPGASAEGIDGPPGQEEGDLFTGVTTEEWITFATTTRWPPRPGES